MSDMKKAIFSLSNSLTAPARRSPTEAAGAIHVDKGRWSSEREVILRILHCETLNAFGRELT